MNSFMSNQYVIKMKTLTLIVLLICSVNLFAQKSVDRTPEKAINKIATQQTMEPASGTPVKPYVMMSSKSPNMIGIGSSGNAYTLIVESSTCLTANQDLMTMMFTARANPAAGYGVNSGSIFSAISSDKGYSWEMVGIADDGKYNRYPSGVIYNPTGNTDPMNAYAVACGPTTDGAAWVETFWASAKLDSTNHHLVYESSTAQDFPRYGMSAPGSGKVHVLGDKYVFTTNVGITTWEYMLMNNGTFNAATNSFDWDKVEIYNAFHQPNGPGTQIHVSNYNTAWSPDGSVGYVWALGIDSANPNTSYQPVVFKSVDEGATWTKLPFYDFANNTTIYNNIWATLSDELTKRPYFGSEIDGVVDNDGNLHLVGVITGAYSIHPDSLGYFFKWEPKHLYHVYTTATGWEADHISTINTLTVAADESGYGSGADALGWDHRVQMSRTADGTKIFATWTDSDTTQYDLVIAPNINVWGKNLTTNNYYPVTDFTTGTLIDGMCYYHYTSDIALDDGANIIIPTTITGLGATPLNPVTHYYLATIGFGPTIGIREVNKSNPLSLIGNFPNPASDITDIRLHLGQASNLSVEVFSVTGQKVLSSDFGYQSAGEHKLTLDVQNLRSGVYVYIVKAGNDSASGKMVRK